jgi:proteasome activator subunit 4
MSDLSVPRATLTLKVDAVQVVDAVQLYDLVLRMVFDYASTNVRSNAVRAIHQLVECVANANPAKTLAKFLPFCLQNIQTELENGASSLRTTASSSPLPSDATLHWSMLSCRSFYISY